MRHRPLNYESKGTAQPARFTADVVMFCLGLAYATVNVVLMLELARGRLDRLPLELIGAFWVVSSVGTMTAFPTCLALRRCGITWRSGLGATLLRRADVVQLLVHLFRPPQRLTDSHLRTRTGPA